MNCQYLYLTPFLQNIHKLLTLLHYNTFNLKKRIDNENIDSNIYDDNFSNGPA